MYQLRKPLQLVNISLCIHRHAVLFLPVAVVLANEKVVTFLTLNLYHNDSLHKVEIRVIGKSLFIS